MTPEQIREKGLFPYLPLPFPDHAEGGMLFPKMTIDVLPRLTRFDLDFDLPEQFLPDKAPPIYLTTRPDLGDVSKGKVITLENYYEIFNGLLNPKQLEGLRLLLTQFPQQQFNATEDRRTDRADGMIGVTCFDCHVNGHTNKATHLVGDIRPAGVPAPDQHAVPSRRERPAPLRLAARPEDGRGLHRVRAARRLLRRRPRHGRQEGRQRARAGLPGALHVRVHGDPRLPAGARSWTSTESWTRRRRLPPRREARPSSSARRDAPRAIPLPITPTTTCTT